MQTLIFERVVLQDIYQRGYKLPDTAQELIAEANCQPDFVYKDEKIAFFCDGSVTESLDVSFQQTTTKLFARK